MKVVIQCAASKNEPTPGSGFQAPDGKPIRFVANPKLTPPDETFAYAHPDDKSDRERTWRELVLEYNHAAMENPLGLMPAYQLYAGKSYENLVKKFGIKNVFILSAGWGLIPADFFTPYYDITFSKAKNVPPHCIRRKDDFYDDICQIPDDGENIVFLGGKDYRPLFCRLTANLKGEKVIFFKSTHLPSPAAGFRFKRYETDRRTNWHYECAAALIDGQISI